jgi:hypothetical protein
LKLKALAVLCFSCRAIPEPGFSWLLSRIVTLLDGYGNQVGAAGDRPGVALVH